MVRKKKAIKKSSSKNSWISNKIEKIMKDGVRINTHKPVSKTNPRRPVSLKQATAIAESMYKRRK